MAATGISTSHDLAQKNWQKKAFREWLDRLVLAPYMGTDESSIIQVNEDLKKEKGDKIVFNLLAGLRGMGVTGDSTLEGSEEALNSYGQTVTLEQYRNAVRLSGKLAAQRYPFEMKDKARPALGDWMAQTIEDLAFAAMVAYDGSSYGAAGSTNRDLWNVNNSDRSLYGAAVANYNATHATGLGNVDGTTDVLNPAQITLAKRLAKKANPRIRPIRLGDASGMEVYVMFAHPYCTRDLRASSDWQNANQYAMNRGNDNPIFTGAIGMYDGVIVIESDKIPVIASVGASNIDVAHNVLCGAQALLFAQGGMDGMQQQYVEESFDYENQVGVAIASMFKIEKARFGTGAAGVSKDHGCFHVFSAAVAD